MIGDRNSVQPNWLTVTCVAANAKQEDWAADPYPEMYLAALQNPDWLERLRDAIAKWHTAPADRHLLQTL